MNYLTDQEKEETLGISFLYSKHGTEDITDFLGFVTQLYNCGFNPRTYQVQKENRLRCILIPTGVLSAYNFDLTKEDRLVLIEQGRLATRKFCDRYLQFLADHTKPIRRYSVG